MNKNIAVLDLQYKTDYYWSNSTNTVAPEPEFHHRTHKSPPPVPILSQLDPLYTPPPPANLTKILSDPILHSTPWSPELSFLLAFPTKPCVIVYNFYLYVMKLL
jgi:hypothetical protein